MNEKLRELLDSISIDGPVVDHVMTFTFDDEEEEQGAYDNNASILKHENKYLNKKADKSEDVPKGMLDHKGEPESSEEKKEEDPSTIVIGFKKGDLTSADVISTGKNVLPTETINAMLVAISKKASSLLEIPFDKVFLKLSEAMIGVIAEATTEDVFRLMGIDL